VDSDGSGAMRAEQAKAARRSIDPLFHETPDERSTPGPSYWSLVKKL
jgi:hypothetical protein